MKSLGESPNRYARIAGIFYLLIIVFGIFGQIFVRDSLINYWDAAITAHNILESQTIWRIGLLGDLLMHALDIPLMIILYFLLSPVSKLLAMVSVLFNVVQTAVLVANKMVLLAPLILVSSGHFSSAYTAEQINAQVLLLVEMHNYGFALGLIFFGFACVGYGLLIFRSNYFPRFLGVFMVAAGVSYLLNSFALLMVPSLAETVFFVLIFSFIGELSFSLWLVVKGVDTDKWKRKLGDAQSC